MPSSPHRTLRFRAFFGVIAVFVVCGTTAPHAADLSAVLPRPVPTFTQVDPSTWVVTVSGSLQIVPRYPGASDYTPVGYPSIDIRRLGEPRRFSAPDDGFSLSLYDDPVFRIGPTARIVPGRYYGDDRRHLFGLRDARFAVEPGVFAEFYPVSFIRTRVEARQGVYGHHGTVGSVAADYLIPTEKLLFSIGPRFNIGDASFARKYFGVSPAEAALNGRVTPYDPRSFYSAGVLGAVTYTQNETWAYTAFAGYTRILGASGDSPLVRRPFGSPDQFQFGVKLDYSFTTPALF
ncbi:MipA/OmpV family protein [Methylobacterium sp. J-072]|uniref:MipA/OmpV family protein n=1 Tax=unclassified Methylobacterium TaxID=2615210 RepID=UPI001FB87221|nr:MipA/OmpV family protein [Methylobacterium sp. J-072]MCJ2091076.1 MipA/OmpV family protein [Methylobacterium sp. J-072]